MRSLDEILEAARRLSEADRRRLLDELSEGRDRPAADRRKAAMEKWLAMAGVGEAAATDLSGNKNRYLAEAYATKP